MGAERRISGYSIFTAIVIAGAVFAYIWMFYVAGYASGQRHERGVMAREHHAAEAGNNFSGRCDGLAVDARGECVRESAQSEREEQRNYSDLAAQWEAVSWAEWAAVIAGIQLAATIVGLFFVRRTLDATWEAVDDTSRATRAMERQNEITEDTARRQLRAYVIPKDAAVQGLSPGNAPVFVFQLHNSGQTPAYEVRYVASVDFTIEEADSYPIRFRGKERIGHSKDTIGPGDFKVAVVASTEPISEDQMAQLYSGIVKAVFAGIISYRDTFGRRRLSTFKAFVPINSKTIGKKVADMISCEIGNYGN